MSPLVFLLPIEATPRSPGSSARAELQSEVEFNVVVGNSRTQALL